MSSETANIKRWLKTLPDTQMVLPLSPLKQLKYLFWKAYTPIHPLVRNTLVFLGILKHTGRQNFLLGRIAPGHTIKEVASFLVSRGYGNHFVAWKDAGELISLRRVENFEYQCHIRIFEDGEVRAHYEYTPEYHPILHLRGIGQKDRRGYFTNLLGRKIIAPQQNDLA